MKKNTKIIVICLAILLIIGTVVAIVLLNNKKYTDKYSSEELYASVSDSFVTDGGTRVLDQDVILEFCEEQPSYLIDYIIVKAKTPKNINEIGIFKVEKDATKDMEKLVQEYVSNLQQSYRNMDYFPEEVEKIDCATVKVLGNYVIYSFLNENDTDAFYDALTNTLKK